MKKIALTTLCLALLFASVSCGKTAQPSDSPPAEPAEQQADAPPAEPEPVENIEGGGENLNEGSDVGADLGAEGQTDPGAIDIPGMSSERNEALLSAFTPENAEIIADIPGSVVMQSQQPLSDLITFYRTALGDAGASQTFLDETREGFWTYAGTYESGKTLVVDLRDDAGNVNIMITY
ncbi:MAG: hypothetical protein LBT44_03495 [Clostridiales bacterium]|jgi:hypothetical protein|nr:hypothetical protein [Clostridiales bacterium]